MRVIGKNDNLCSRCGSKHILVIEKTLSNNSRRIDYIYRCSGCGFKTHNGSLTITKVNGGVRILISQKFKSSEESIVQ